MSQDPVITRLGLEILGHVVTNELSLLWITPGFEHINGCSFMGKYHKTSKMFVFCYMGKLTKIFLLILILGNIICDEGEYNYTKPCLV